MVGIVAEEKKRGYPMSLIQLLKDTALQCGFLTPEAEMTPETVFTLVRDMPYQRASDRRPETLIREWRGTCSGKHYLLRELFAELGYASRVMACTCASPVDGARISPELLPLWQAAGGRFVDVHNYLILELPQGEMIVDATWPVNTQKLGLITSAEWVPGQDQQIACTPLQHWKIPPGREPQDFKNELLQAHFTPEELAFREAFIHALSAWVSQQA